MRPKKIILCVDGDVTTLALRRFMLRCHGYRVISALGARRAVLAAQWAAAQGIRIDLVVSELRMAPVDGNELCRELRGLLPDVPQMLVSRFVKVYPRGICADLFLPKSSFTAAELVERVRVMCTRKRGPKKKPAQREILLTFNTRRAA